ncbi:MAG: hypothetical protein AB7E47_09835 [Desulfovibrionaceae bacterium]
MSLDAIAQYASPFIGSGLVVWFMKDRFAKSDVKMDRIHQRLDRIEAEQQKSALSVAVNCATREDTKELWRRVDEHQSRITRLEERC